MTPTSTPHLTAEDITSLRARGYSPSAVPRYLPRAPAPSPRPDPNLVADTLKRLHAQELRTALSIPLSREMFDRVEWARRESKIAVRRRRARVLVAVVVLSVATGAVILAEFVGNDVAKGDRSHHRGRELRPGLDIVVAEAESFRWLFTGCAAGVALAMLVALWMNSGGTQ